MLDKIVREKIEQLRVRRRFAAQAEVRWRVDQPFAEVMLLDAVGHYARGEWIGRTRNPVGEFKPATRAVGNVQIAVNAEKFRSAAARQRALSAGSPRTWMNSFHGLSSATA